MKNKTSIIATIIIVYLISIALYFAFLHLGITPISDITMNNGEFIPILRPDAGLYGYYANNIIKGVSYPFTAEYMPAHLLVFISKITTFSIDKTIFYLSGFISSLVVIPMILLGYLIKAPRFGVYSALLGIFSISYYLRTQFGYFDTDILNVFWVLMISVCMIWYLKKDNLIALVFSALFIIAFSYWYHSYKVIALFLICLYILSIFIYSKKSSHYQSIVLLLIAISPANIVLKLSLITIFLLMIITYKKLYDESKSIKYWQYAIVGIIISGFIYLIFEPSYYERALEYLSKNSNLVLTQNSGEKLYFQGELTDVIEAQELGFYKTLYLLMFDSYILLALSISGLIMLSIRFKYLLIYSLFGFMFFVTMKSGIRFSIFAIFPLMSGLSYMIYILEDKLKQWLKQKNKLLHKFTSLIFILFFSLSMLYLHKHSQKNILFNKDDIQALRQADINANKNDFMLSGWTYGWYIWYFSKFNTLVDNGKHHLDKHIIAKFLFSHQLYTAYASRYFLEQCNNRGCNLSRKLYKDKTPQYVDNHILKTKKTKDIYFFLHERMLLETNLIKDFYINKNKSKKNQRKYFSETILSVDNIKKNIQTKSFLLKQRNKTIIVKASNQQIKFNRLFVVRKNNTMAILQGDTKSSFYTIIYKEKYLIILHKDLIESFFIQAFIFNNLDKNLFKFIKQTPTSKIIKLVL